MIIRDQFFQKEYFIIESRILELDMELISIGSKFHLEKSIKNFRTKFAQPKAFLIQNWEKNIAIKFNSVYAN